MQPNSQFVGLPKEFWANIRTISQEVGYTVRPKRVKGQKGQLGPIKVPTLSEIETALAKIRLTATHLINAEKKVTDLGKQVVSYFEYRADALNRIIEPLLMNSEQAVALFTEIQSSLNSSTSVPMNKQSKEKKKPAYFTGMINMLIKDTLGERPCNYNPQELTTITRNNEPYRTLARRIDGAFPGPVDPIAVWEIKEYYYTTTFGSRVADGVYETLLDGMELEELDESLRELASLVGGTRHIQHILMVDAHFTWWVKGRSYLCRIIDMLHMGYVDEVLFGREIRDRLPILAKGWMDEYQRRITTNP
jgi:hypothetical protein